MYCPCNEHNEECGKPVEGLRCHLDRNHEGDCIWGIPLRPSPDQLKGEAARTHAARQAGV